MAWDHARYPDHSHLADRIGIGLARLARRAGQSAALSGSGRRTAASNRPMPRLPHGSTEPGERSGVDQPSRRGGQRPGNLDQGRAGRRPSAAHLGVWIDPKTAEPIERASSSEGVVRVLHVLHGNLMVPGVGRQIVGWIGVAMLLSSLTGIWLWWPLKGSVTPRIALEAPARPQFESPLHTGGFWISLPLAVLSLTGVWISFPDRLQQFNGSRSVRRTGRPQCRLQQTQSLRRSSAGGGSAARVRAKSPRSLGRPTRRPSGRSRSRREGTPHRGEGRRTPTRKPRSVRRSPRRSRGPCAGSTTAPECRSCGRSSSSSGGSCPRLSRPRES